uniref:Ribosomal protein S7 n=1 Tax=Closterium baillyanum TaxID=1416941 RepID=U5YE49_9VIRI|nr:ribosomal protein S7 [Closterium baillyanum]AGZ90263.1 ribosomal protein S7 [Closterium baillyanum]
MLIFSKVKGLTVWKAASAAPDVHLNFMYSSFQESKSKPLRGYAASAERSASRLAENMAKPFSYIRDLNAAQKHCLQKFINLCMIDGKKNKSQKIISNTLCRLAGYGDVLTFIMKAIDNVKPIIEVRRRSASGSTQLVPSIISRNRQETLAIRWIVEAAIKRRNTKKSMSLDQCLLAELIDAFQKIGTVRKRRDDLHKLAESNRGFAHYRWW